MSMGENPFGLDSRVAVVTGASSGIGAGVAVAMGEAGATVCLAGRNHERLAAVAHAIGERSSVVAVDLRDEEAPATIVEHAVATHGGIDVLVHSAGLFFPTPFEQTAVDDFDLQWDVNVRAPFRLTQAALPHLGRGSSVIFISSNMGAAGGSSCAAYCATKGAIEQLCRALTVELGGRGVRFNTIAPGAIETAMNEGFRTDPEFYESNRAFAPAGRWGLVGDIAPAAVFLAGPGADFVHGARLAIDGGWVAR
jgi:NAD(P)-dependent dehydrogenase (short-subunit alcohol dehydrogenase family)